MSPSPAPPRLLTIAGSDSGGGAGIQADLKTFAAHGAFGMSVLTAVTAQNTVAVVAVREIEAEIVAAQIDAVFSDLGVDAVKIGMLASAAVIGAVAERLTAWLGQLDPAKRPPVVLDPVMVAKSGDRLLAEEAVQALVERLMPLATLVTPNLPEALVLAGVLALEVPQAELSATGEDERRELAARIAAAGPSVLLKGGHAPGATVLDVLVDRGRTEVIRHPRVEGSSTHGTGCTLSSAIAARLGRGDSLPEAVRGAIAYLQEALAAAYPLGRGQGPVNHLWFQEPVA